MGRWQVLVAAVLLAGPAAGQVNRENITGPLRDALQQREQRIAEEQQPQDAQPEHESAKTQGVELAGVASLPPDLFRPGPTSGQFIEPANGRTPPFPDRQPIQGISAVIRAADGRLLGLSDNGFGSKANSADYVLTVYELRPDFRTRRGGSGMLRIAPAFELHDPDRRIPFPIVADAEVYPAADSQPSTVPVDPRIRDQRLLTGADFDPESFRQLDDGSFVFGDEFGPFLLHTDANGRVLAAPVDLPTDHAPQHPTRSADRASLGASAGFEGMATQGERLLPMLEKPRPGDGRRVAVFSYDPQARQWQGEQPLWYYPLDEGTAAIGDFTHVAGDRFLVIERDTAQGPEATVKRLYLADAAGVKPGGTLRKRLVADLLALPDPHGLSPHSRNGVLRLPFVTIESVVMLDPQRVGILNDNNYPFSVGRHADTTREPDPTEFVVLRLAERLD